MQSFIDYVMSFYGEGEIYDKGFTREEIEAAIAARIKNTGVDFEGDSLDREIVRDIVIVQRAIRKIEHDKFVIETLFG